MNIPRLFVKLFVPTLLGLLFGAMLNLADGIFVGRGVGSDALAAINIAAPLFLVATGLALMFGAGVSSCCRTSSATWGYGWPFLSRRR